MPKPHFQYCLNPATQIHLDDCWQLYKSSMRGHIEQLWGWQESWQQQNFMEQWQSTKTNIICHDDTFIGYLQHSTKHNQLYIWMLIITPKWRSKGIAQRIMNQLFNPPEIESIALRVFHTNLDALRFYQRLGFELYQKEDKFYLLKKVKN